MTNHPNSMFRNNFRIKYVGRKILIAFSFSFSPSYAKEILWEIGGGRGGG
jgi:hypothetical protein